MAPRPSRLEALEARLEAASRRHWTYRLERLGLDPSLPLWHVHVPARGKQLAAICLAAGIHGDEPAGVEALLRLLEVQPFPHGLEIDCFPCMNPQGYEAGTREDAAGRDLNRQFGQCEAPPPLSWFEQAMARRRYDLFIDLHEDCGTTGFYAFELEGEGACLGPDIVQGLAGQGYALEPAGPLERLLVEDGLHYGEHPIEDGLVVHRLGEVPLFGCAQSVFMRTHHAAHAMTFESPSRARFEARVQVHVAGLEILFRRLRQRGLHAVWPEQQAYFASAWSAARRRQPPRR
jgi:hypothetical protein